MKAMSKENINPSVRLMAGDIDTEVEIQHLIETIDQIAEEPSHNTVLYNDDFHNFEEVVHVVRLATGKSLQDSYAITLEAHNNGKAICFSGDMRDCRKVAKVLLNAGLVVEVV